MDDNIVQDNTEEEEEEDSPHSSMQHYVPPPTLITHFSSKHKLFLQRFHLTIPRQIITLDEKYLHHCLHSIHMAAAITSTNTPAATFFLSSSKQDNASSIVASITASTSIINLFNTSLLRHLPTSPIEVTESSSHDLQMKRILPQHKRLVSFSSTDSALSHPSTFSSPSSSTSSSASCQGMLHCSWNNGFPCYVFSLQDHKLVYTTHLSKIGSDYIYKFYSRAGKREIQFHDQDSADLVGKMRVSTSFTPETGIMETQFILCGTDHHSEVGTAMNQTVKKSKGLTKKVSNIFRGHHNRRKTSSSLFDGTEDISCEEGNLCSESSFPSNLELAAIVLKDHTQNKVQVGGWGLKFLNDKQKLVTQSVASTSMDIIVPAGVHGGPRTKVGGPSSLVERWRSGGSCDCGGWDTGCPLTILNAAPNNKQVSYQAGVFGRSNSFELFTQGCKQQSLPVIELGNVHDGLYYIHYQPTLCALQSLSIAVAIIHSHTPTLKP